MLERKTSSLHTLTGKSIDPCEMAVLLSNPLFRAFRDLQTAGFATYRDYWLNNGPELGKSIEVRHAEQTSTGIYRGINEQGFLLLESQGKLLELSSSEVLE